MTAPLDVIFGFLIVLARVTGALVLVPLPGMREAPETARVVLALAMTMTLSGVWPRVPVNPPYLGTLLLFVAAEFALGVTIGIAVALLLEVFQMAAQVLSVQAGYSYASTIDPSTQADSGVLNIFTQLFAGMLFCVLGLDRQVIAVFAGSLKSIAPGSYSISGPSLQSIIALGSNIFSLGLRLALPVVALLLLMDISVALLSRMHSQLQMLSLTFPVKMLATLLTLSATGFLLPSVLQSASEQTFRTLWRLVNR